MGLFDFFGKKKKEEQDAAELLKAIIQYQVESRNVERSNSVTAFRMALPR